MIRASYVGALARIFRYLSDSITILPDAQGQNDAHGTCAAELPGICDVNLVSHTMGDATWPSTWSRGFCKRENPTQGAPVRTVPHGGGEIRPQRTEAAAYRGHEGTFLAQLIVHCLGQRNDALCHFLRCERSVRRARLPPAYLQWVCARVPV